MYPFLAYLLLIGAGFVIGLGYKPGPLGDLLLSIGATLFSAYVGIRFALYQQRKAEYYDLREDLSRWVLLRQQREFTMYFTYEAARKAESNKIERPTLEGDALVRSYSPTPLVLSPAGQVYLYQLQAFLNQVYRDLQKARHDELANVVREADRYYAGVLTGNVALHRESDLDNKAHELADKVVKCRPNPWAFCNGKRLFSHTIVERFTVQPSEAWALNVVRDCRDDGEKSGE